MKGCPSQYALKTQPKALFMFQIHFPGCSVEVFCWPRVHAAPCLLHTCVSCNSGLITDRNLFNPSGTFHENRNIVLPALEKRKVRHTMISSLPRAHRVTLRSVFCCFPWESAHLTSKPVEMTGKILSQLVMGNPLCERKGTAATRSCFSIPLS